ncbi:hypothetical protein GCM10010399_03670 [Dactylosporangium fulvum]
MPPSETSPPGHDRGPREPHAACVIDGAYPVDQPRAIEAAADAGAPVTIAPWDGRAVLVTGASNPDRLVRPPFPVPVHALRAAHAILEGILPWAIPQRRGA